MKTAGKAAIGLLAAFFGIPLAANGTVINVDLQGYRGSESAPTTYSGASPTSSGTVWNGVTVPNNTIGAAGSPSSNPAPHGVGFSDGSSSTTTGDRQTIPDTGLVDEAGGSTPVTIGGSPLGVDNEVPGLGANPFGDYVFSNSAGNNGLTASLTIKGLADSSAVKIFLYSDSPSNLQDVSVNGTSTWNTAGSYNSPFTAINAGQNSGNTKEFDVTTSPTGTVTINLNSVAFNVPDVLSGVTIVGTVPEPTSIGLLGFGAIGLLGRRRHE